MKKLKLVYYGRADLCRWNGTEYEDIPVKLETGKPIIVAFPSFHPEATDFIAVYEVIEE